MRILFLGDIMGRSGRDAVIKHLPEIKEKLNPDSIIINIENAAHGKGINEKICKQLFEHGASCLTSGNHMWDKREIIFYIDKEPRLIRPINYPENTPGKGSYIQTLSDGRKFLVVNAMCRLFMDPLDDPFAAMKDLTDKYTLGKNIDAIFLDFHGETTSEKMSMAAYMDGKISAVVGTHTHIPTADCQIFPGGTAFQSDAGMCGDYDSVIGVRKDIAIHRFTRKMPGEKMEPASGEGTICGTFIETDGKTGLSKRIEPVRIGPRLIETIPSC